MVYVYALLGLLGGLLFAEFLLFDLFDFLSGWVCRYFVGFMVKFVSLL